MFNTRRAALPVVVALTIVAAVAITSSRRDEAGSAPAGKPLPVADTAPPSGHEPAAAPTSISSQSATELSGSVAPRAQPVPLSLSAKSILRTAGVYADSSLQDSELLQMATNVDLAGGVPYALPLAAMPLPGDLDLQDKAAYAIAMDLRDPADAAASAAMMRQIVAFAALSGGDIDVGKARNDARRFIGASEMPR
jgi:hypothetical protein